MKRWKKMMIGSIVLGMSLVFGACGNQEDSSEESANEITVSTWNYETTPEFKALFEAFEKKTGIKVKAVDIAFTLIMIRNSPRCFLLETRQMY